MPAIRSHRQRDRRSNDPGYERRIIEVIEDVMSGKYASWSDAHRQTGVGILFEATFILIFLLGPKIYVDNEGEG